jgi:hypothetical protein
MAIEDYLVEEIRAYGEPSSVVVKRLQRIVEDVGYRASVTQAHKDARKDIDARDDQKVRV